MTLINWTESTRFIWTDESVATLKRMHEQGYSYSQIGAKVGATRCAVAGKVLRLELPSHKPKPKPKPKPKRRVLHLVPPLPDERAPLPADDIDIPLEQRRTLVELTNETCRWPVGEPDKPGFFFCGGPANLNLKRPYCQHHMRRA